MMVVSAKYSVPQLLDDKLAKKDYRDVYIDLNSASIPETKIFIEDLGADGLKAKREENTGERRRCADRRDCRCDQRFVRQLRCLQGASEQSGRRPLRQRLGVGDR